MTLVILVLHHLSVTCHKLFAFEFISLRC